jgi:hypothetical protein
VSRLNGRARAEGEGEMSDRPDCLWVGNIYRARRSLPAKLVDSGGRYAGIYWVLGYDQVSKTADGFTRPHHDFDR